jgi:hypothetical protein
LLLGLTSGETDWSSKETIALLVVGAVLLGGGAVWERYTTKSAIIPPRLFKTRTTAVILISVFLHAVVFFTGAFYLPLYFQALGSSATNSGIRMIPFSFGGAALSTISGILVSRLGDYRIVMWFGWVWIFFSFLPSLFTDNL